MPPSKNLLQAAQALKAAEKIRSAGDAIDEFLKKRSEAVDWERFVEKEPWAYREPEIPEVQYFIGYRGEFLKRLDIIPRLVAGHEEKYPDRAQCRMVFCPKEKQGALRHSMDILSLRKRINEELERAQVDWRLRELIRFQSEGVRFVFVGDEDITEDWFSRNIILIFERFGVADI